MSVPKRTIEERAVRFQRRYTGPFRTVGREIGPVVITTRYRRRTRIEYVELAVAGHDLWVHVLWRGTIVPVLLPIVRWLNAHLP